jgi:hypothetical protein
LIDFSYDSGYTFPAFSDRAACIELLLPFRRHPQSATQGRESFGKLLHPLQSSVIVAYTYDLDQAATDET